MATVAETLQRRNKKALEVSATRAQSQRSFQDRMGLQQRSALQKALTKREGPQGVQRIRKASRTAEPQVQKGRKPGQSRVQGLLQTGRVRGRRRLSE